jgi:hypothetical protein
MPRKKITLEEAYAVFEQHGLQVKQIVPMQTDAVAVQPADLVDIPPYGYKEKPKAAKVFNDVVKISLRCRHSISQGGFLVANDKSMGIQGNSVETYGPGIVYVSSELAQHLLHKDAMAVQTENDMLSPQFKSRVIVQRGRQFVPMLVSDDPSFRMSQQYFDADTQQYGYQGILLS